MLLSVWQPGPSGGSLSLVPCSFQGSLSKGSLSMGVSVHGVSVQGGLCLGGLCQRDPPDRDPPYGKEWAVCILLECILVFKSILS